MGTPPPVGKLEPFQKGVLEPLQWAKLKGDRKED